MNPAVFAAVAVLIAGPSAIDGPEYSFSEGSGGFYALRHSPQGKEAHEEVVGSGIAMNRARRQAQEGGYALEIKGPFAGIREATIFIRKEWDPSFGKPKKPVYVVTPDASGKGEDKDRL